MNQHLNLWLDAYLDGELTASQRARVEDHLANCSQCQSLLDRRRSLSSLLLLAPPATAQKEADQFVAEVRLQASLRSSRSRIPIRPAALRPQLWQYAPLVLLFGWAFVQSVSIVSFLATLLPGLDQVLGKSIMELNASGAFSWLKDANLSGLNLVNLDLILPLNLFHWNWLASLSILAVGALIYLGWLAVWWASIRQRNEI
jgi:hypothetical protein